MDTALSAQVKLFSSMADATALTDWSKTRIINATLNSLNVDPINSLIYKLTNVNASMDFSGYLDNALLAHQEDSTIQSPKHVT